MPNIVRQYYVEALLALASPVVLVVLLVRALNSCVSQGHASWGSVDGSAGRVPVGRVAPKRALRSVVFERVAMGIRARGIDEGADGVANFYSENLCSGLHLVIK
jgi:hypothetical protein